MPAGQGAGIGDGLERGGRGFSTLDGGMVALDGAGIGDRLFREIGAQGDAVVGAKDQTAVHQHRPAAAEVDAGWLATICGAESLDRAVVGEGGAAAHDIDTIIKIGPNQTVIGQGAACAEEVHRHPGCQSRDGARIHDKTGFIRNDGVHLPKDAAHVGDGARPEEVKRVVGAPEKAASGLDGDAVARRRPDTQCVDHHGPGQNDGHVGQAIEGPVGRGRKHVAGSGDVGGVCVGKTAPAGEVGDGGIDNKTCHGVLSNRTGVRQ